ncbi:hypothetical protein [Salibacterium halotolerans]|uniref:hypothetical protein n=1 Tax=Salibacterium halotolerans TaxID=1884432 RepID=UPI00147EC4B0|nr:hypothetical protein [Salibacterium halotolerans]
MKQGIHALLFIGALLRTLFEAEIEITGIIRSTVNTILLLFSVSGAKQTSADTNRR